MGQGRSQLALLVWLGLYPAALVVDVFLAPWLRGWPTVLSTLVTTLVLVLFVVYVSLPLLQRVVSRDQVG